ncbi:MAG: hypothetical protein HQM16_16470 [Deltaproteobacteria bacterium]|nr:hypothetical protein [Deltaproteobacteria bacterium]
MRQTGDSDTTTSGGLSADKIIHDMRNKIANIGAYLRASRDLEKDATVQTIYRNAVDEHKELNGLLNDLDDFLAKDCMAVTHNE